MTDPFAWMAVQIIDAKPAPTEPSMSLSEETEQEILAWIKKIGRPVTWCDVADEFSISRRQATKRLSAIKDKLHVDRSGNMKGLPARYTWRGA